MLPFILVLGSNEKWKVKIWEGFFSKAFKKMENGKNVTVFYSRAESEKIAIGYLFYYTNDVTKVRNENGGSFSFRFER